MRRSDQPTKISCGNNRAGVASSFYRSSQRLAGDSQSHKSGRYIGRAADPDEELPPKAQALSALVPRVVEIGQVVAAGGMRLAKPEERLRKREGPLDSVDALVNSGVFLRCSHKGWLITATGCEKLDEAP